MKSLHYKVFADVRLCNHELVNIEAVRRLGEFWTITLESQLFSNIDRECVMLKSIALTFSVLLLSFVCLEAKTHNTKANLSSLSSKSNLSTTEELNVGRVWALISGAESFSYEWPGGTGVSYLFVGYLWVGAENLCISRAWYTLYEYSGWTIHGPSKLMGFIESEYCDWYDDPRWDISIRQLGLNVTQKVRGWAVEGFEDFVVYEYKFTYIADSSLHKSDTLKGVYISWVTDADCGEGVSPDDHIDDLVSYDGWVNNEWQEAYRPYSRVNDSYPYDEVTIYPDGTIDSMPDGIWDQIAIFGDEHGEFTLHGDTLYLWRNISYMYDGDNLERPGDDEGESGMTPGYIGGIVLYAPRSPNDSIWVDEYGDTCRMIRPMTHQWWNWKHPPKNDKERYLYMIGKHELSQGYRFMPHPLDWYAEAFDYRFMHTFGPYEIADSDTLEFVFAGLMGLDGGYGYDEGVVERMFKEGGWYPGIRYTADQALKAYYLGSEFSDPVHPSSPSEDTHWLIRVPPEVPYLQYSARQGAIALAWSDIAEITPDPIDNIYDFAGYRIYRAEFQPGQWYLIKGFVDSAFGSENPDSFPVDIYKWIGKGEAFPNIYVDTNIIYGVPYLYVVTAFDIGRPPLSPSLESRKINYKQTESGVGLSIPAKTENMEEPLTANKLDKITVAPNPYLGSAQWERKDETRIQFMNLPGSCRILIYTISGDLVKEIEHTDGTGDEHWDLLSRNELSVVSGLYVYKIEAWDDKNKPIYKIGKLVIVR